MKAGVSPAELLKAGFSQAAIDKALAAQNSEDCSVAHLKAERAAGVSAKALKHCGIASLLAAGFTPKDLLDAGFTPKQLLDAGVTAAQLLAAGVTPQELLAAGVSPADLLAAGISPELLKALGADLCSPIALAKARADGVPASKLKSCGIQALLAAGFSPQDLLNAGFSPEELLAAGVSPAVLKALGINGVDKMGKAASIDSLNSPEGQSTNGVDDKFAKRLAAMKREQEEALSQAQREQKLAMMRAQMQQQSQQLMAGWSHVSSQQLVVNPAAKGSKSASGKSGADADSGSIIKAGTVNFAVLLTGVNSDENSPVLAKIVSGPLKGAKLIGAFTLLKKRVELRFQTINIPDQQKTLPLSAVAIDSNTAHTALKGQINNHYLLRYGSLFASSFLTGFASAMQAGTKIVLPGGIDYQNSKDLTPAQQVAVGLGNVGTQYSSTMKSNFNTPPTIKIASGTGSGTGRHFIYARFYCSYRSKKKLIKRED